VDAAAVAIEAARRLGIYRPRLRPQPSDRDGPSCMRQPLRIRDGWWLPSALHVGASYVVPLPCGTQYILAHMPVNGFFAYELVVGEDGRRVLVGA
jgi:hypothetical protein